MIYRLTVLLFCFCTAALMAQKPVFDIKYSEQLAVFVFVQNLSSPNPENPFKAAFLKSAYNTKEYNGLITAFDTLAIDYSYQFTEYPYVSKMPGITRELLKKNLIATTSLQEFKLRSLGLVTNATLNELVSLLNTFTPIYRELIYEPNKIKFEKQLADLTAYSQAKNITDYFDMGLVFYHTTWDDSIPFEIAFYPLPNAKGFTAQAFYNNFISAIQTETTDYDELFSVMLHEIFHIIYDEQSLSVKKDIQRYFKENPSLNSAYAYLLLNEALATALGNGYVYGKLKGEIDPNKWYNWKYISDMAQQMYPLVSQYITEKKPMDQAFINAYIQLYDTHFPEWTNEMDNLMNYRYMLSENKSDFTEIRKVYPHGAMTEEEDAVTESSIAKMKAIPLSKIVIVSKDNKTKLAMIRQQFPELKNWKFEAAKEFEYTILLRDKTRLFLINQINTPTSVLLKKLKVGTTTK